MMRRGLILGLITALFALIGVGVAWGYFTATDGAHSAQAEADTLPAGQTPSVSISYPSGVATATVTFNRATTSFGRTVSTFAIKRYSTATGGSASVQLACTPGGTGSSVSCTESGVPAGTWYYSDTPTFAGSAWAGSESGRSNSITPDTTAPSVVYGQNPAPNGNGFNNTVVAITLTATDAGTGVASITYKIDSGSNVVVPTAAATTFNVSGDGNHTVTYFATDNAGNSSVPAQQNLKIDSTPPATPAITSLPGSINISNKASVTIAGTAEPGSTVAISLTDTGAKSLTNSATAAAGSGSWSFTFDTSTLADGAISVVVTATDPAGNITNPGATAPLTKDTVAPSISSPAIGSSAGTSVGFIRQGGGYYVYANVTDATSGVSSVTANASAITSTATAVTLTTASGPWTVGGTTYAYRSAQLLAGSPLSGSKSFTVSAVDAVGNTPTPASGSVTVDNSAPTAPTITTKPTVINAANKTAVTFGGAAETGATVSLALSDGTSTVTATVVASAGAWSITVNASSLTDHSITVTAFATDPAGNVSGNTQTTVAKDVLPPTVTNVALANGGTTQGRADKGDTVTITLSEQIDALTICPSWTNGSDQTLGGNGNVNVTITDAGNNDVLSVSATSCPGLKVGSIALGANYVGSTTSFSGSGSNASAVDLLLNGTSLVITLGAGSGSATGVGNSTPVFTPTAGIKDMAANALATTPVSGTSSKF